MPNLEEEIINELASKMQSEMDFSILADMLVQLGWHRVNIDRFKDNRHAVDIKLWCEEHIKNPWESRGTLFVFEDQGDAVNFVFKWVN